MLGLIGGNLPWSHPLPDAPSAEVEVEVTVEEPLTIPCPAGNIAKSKVGGFWGTVVKGFFTIVIMGINAFCAAIATQVYKIFTGRWRDGGGSDIPVINSSPGGGSSPGSAPGTASRTGGGNQVSSDFLNRYRD